MREYLAIIIMNIITSKHRRHIVLGLMIIGATMAVITRMSDVNIVVETFNYFFGGVLVGVGLAIILKFGW